MTTITVKAGQKPTKEQIKRIRAAAKSPITYTPDCPESTPEALAEFAAKARELRQNLKRTKPAVTIRITPDCLTKYKALGKGYTGIMADVLNYVADNPEILSKATVTR
ncbi:MAG: BrnA antitoxin family protein [Treponema sp.]|nr:BrnA antitoxin family protein [Treponema sp.]